MRYNNNLEMDIMEIKPILQKLKDGLRNAKPELKDDDFGSEIKKERNYKDYYLYCYKNNCFDDPKNIKLGTGTRAIKSSAAFIYNIFGQDEITINDINYGEIKYEEPLKALIGRNPAKLDGCLISKDNSKIKFFETKLLEWSGSPKNLSLAYLDKNNYFKCNNHREDFINFFTTISGPETKPDKKGEIRRKHKTKVYDAIQMTIHILGIYNAVCNNKILQKNIELVNLVWDYPHSRYEKEKTEALDYEKKFNDYFKPFFKEKGFDFKVKYISFSDFILNTDIKFKKLERFEYLKKRYLLNK